MSNVVGHLLYKNGKLEGELGTYYNYIMAGNGVFIRAENDIFTAIVPVEMCKIRGLDPLATSFQMLKGKIPGVLFDLAFNTSLTHKEKETFYAINWEDKYHLFYTNQDGNPGHVQYQTVDNTIMDIHTHPTMAGRFSGGDNADDTGFKLSAVIGHLDDRPEISLRIGVYGYFYEIPWSDIFDGTLKDIENITLNRPSRRILELVEEEINIDDLPY